MSVARKVTAATAAAGVMALPAGCSYGQPSFETPNGTCETAMDNSELARQPVHQSFSFSIRTTPGDNGELVLMCNLTETPIDENKFAAAVNYFAGISLPQHQTYPNALEARVEMDDKESWMTIQPIGRTTPEHSFILLKNPDDIPKKHGDASAFTLYLPNGINAAQQAVSIVTNPEGISFDKDAGIYVEVCQSVVWARSVDTETPSDPVDAALLNRMVQEIYCNSWGRAALYAASGDTYEAYMQFIQDFPGGYYSVGSRLFFVDLVAVTPEQYEQMQLALRG